MPYAIHFTPGKTKIGSNLIQCKAIDNIKNDGFRKYTNFIQIKDQNDLNEAYKYIHHGMRTNNARKCGFVNIPAAIWIDSTDLIRQQGYDGKTHIQINEKINPNRILSIQYLDINNIISDFVLFKGKKPFNYSFLGRKKYIPFHKEYKQNKEQIKMQLLETWLKINK